MECPLYFTDVSGAGASSVSCRSDSEGEAESGTLARRGEPEVKLFVIEAPGKVGVVASSVAQLDLSCSINPFFFSVLKCFSC